MPRIPIDSLADPRVRPYLDLRNRRLRTRDGKFIAEGDLVVARLLESGHPVESLVVAEDQLSRVAVPDNLVVYVVPPALIKSLVGFNFHRGILACGIRPTLADLSDLAPPATAGEAVVLVVCAAIHDPENLGGILRNCAAFGVHGVLISRDSADPFSRRVLRVSMGAVLKIPVYQSAQVEQDLQRLRHELGVHVAASVADPTAPPLRCAPCPRRVALVLGNERTGLSPPVLAASESRWTIPMQLRTDSLNVAVASGIFLYHFCQRDGRPESPQ